MSTLVVEGWSMTTGGGGAKSEELACGGMKGRGCCAGKWYNVLATGGWLGQWLPVVPLMG